MIILAVFFPDILTWQIGISLLLWWLPLVVAGMLDDVFFEKISLPARSRFLLQICVWLWVTIYADLGFSQFAVLWFVVEFWYWWGVLLSTLRFVWCINAVNRFDGINGQASGVSSVWYATILFLIWTVVQQTYIHMTPEHTLLMDNVQIVSFILFVLSSAYAIVEWKPSGLVRDPWTFFYGFSLAYLSLIWWAKVWTMLVVLSLVIFDAIWVCLHRIFVLKKAPRKWDYTHLHHRLQWLGRTKKEVNVFLWLWSLVMMILMLLQWDNKVAKIVIFVMMALIFFGVNSYIFWYKKAKCWLWMQIRPVESDKPKK